MNGFMQTGDVFEQRSATRIVWIDRKSNIMKLSQACAHNHPVQPGVLSGSNSQELLVICTSLNLNLKTRKTMHAQR